MLASTSSVAWKLEAMFLEAFMLGWINSWEFYVVMCKWLPSLHGIQVAMPKRINEFIRNLIRFDSNGIPLA